MGGAWCLVQGVWVPGAWWWCGVRRGLTLARMVLNSRLEIRPEPSRSARQKAAHSRFSKPLR